ncbi:MAG: Bax inhibitor-1/YccA family protein [Arachnia sp.]
MANPVFTNSKTFNQAPGVPQQGYGQPGFAPAGSAPNGYPQGYGQPGYGQPGYQQPMPQAAGGVMTMDDVIAKTGLTLLAVFAFAAATFLLVPVEAIFPIMITTGLASLVTVLFVAGRQNLPVAGVMLYAALEGVFVGAISKVFEASWPGIVVSAVLATFIAAGATLAAYKFFNIRVTPKFRKFVLIGTMSLAGVMLVNLVLMLFGVETGLRSAGPGAGWLAILVSVLAVGLAVFNLIVDFDFIERGIAAQAPVKESWRAAFGVTVTMVWLYIEMLRILSYFRN